MTFYAYASEIEDIKAELEKDPDIPGFYTRLGMDPSKISCIVFTEKKQKKNNRAAKIKIKIRVVPDDAVALQRFCDEFEKKTNLRLPYRGESQAALVNRAVLEIMVYRRKYIPPAVRTWTDVLRSPEAGDQVSILDFASGQHVLDSALPVEPPPSVRKTPVFVAVGHAHVEVVIVHWVALEIAVLIVTRLWLV
jgi:hypothetical protein